MRLINRNRIFTLGTLSTRTLLKLSLNTVRVILIKIKSQYTLFIQYCAPFRQDHNEGNGQTLDWDEGEKVVFSRRKLESNWDRYLESERVEPADDTPAVRGTDYHVLLESAGKV